MWAIPAAHGAATIDEASGRLSITPLRFESTSIAPGGTIGGYVVRATNDTDAPLRIQIRAVQLQGSSDPTQLVQPARGDATSQVTSWLQLPYSAANWPTVAAGATLSIPLSVRVPKDAIPGAYAIALGVFSSIRSPSVTTGNEEVESAGRVALDAGPGSTIIFDVTGDAQANAKIRSIDAPRVVWGGDAPSFIVRVKNTGQTQLQLDSRLTLSPFVGTAGRQLDADAQAALPKGEREFRLRWSDPPLFGWFEPRLTVVGGADSGVTITQTLPTVWVLPPWWLIAMLLIALSLPITMLVRRRRSGRSQAVRSAKSRSRIEREQQVAAAKARAEAARQRGGRR